jgi:peptide/nickel transport system permease protein
VARFVLRRLGTSVAAIVGVVLLVFVLARLTGKPGALFLTTGASQEAIDQFNEAHGFNDPLWVQLGHYLFSVAHLDFGESLLFGQPALQVALDHFPYTLTLTLATLLICLVLGVTFGSIAAYYEGGRFDRALGIASSFAVSIPNFWLAIVLILVLSVQLHVLPPSGTGDVASAIMPLITLSIAPIGLIAEVTRNAMRQSLRSEYIVAARAKGMPRLTIVSKHALRNAAIPIVTIAGTIAAAMVNGVLIVETIFSWPGIGYITLQAVTTRDFALLQACVVVTATAVVVVNLVVDLLYGGLDPRISHGGRR